MIYNRRGQQSDRTTVSIIEDYIRGLPPGTWATPKMVAMNVDLPTARASAFLTYLNKRGVVDRKLNPEGHFIYTSGTRHVDRQFAKRAENPGPPKGTKHSTHMTKTGVELKLAPPPPVENRLTHFTGEQANTALSLLLAEFGLEVWEIDGIIKLRNAK